MLDKYNTHNDKIKRKTEKIFWSNVNNENEIYGAKKKRYKEQEREESCMTY